FVAQFPDLFAAEYNSTLHQAMFLSNSPLFDQLLTGRGDNLTARLLGLPEATARIRAAFAAVFGRAPASDELRECADYLEGRPGRGGAGGIRGLSGGGSGGGGRKAASRALVEQRGVSVESLRRDPFSKLPNPAGGGVDHPLHRRKFLQGVAGAGAFSLMSWGG